MIDACAHAKDGGEHAMGDDTQQAAQWRVPPLRIAPAGTLLNEGIAAFERLALDPTPTLRWYRSTEPAIVLGRGQGAIKLRDTGIDVVHRFSGGGAVWLSPDVLSLDVLLPAGHPWVSEQLPAVFDHVGEAWLRALTDLGVPDLWVYAGAATARRRGNTRQQMLAAVCYATKGRGEVFWREHKLIGLAQRRRRHAAMVQCGLLRRWRPQRLLEALGADPCDQEVLDAAVGLDDIGGAAPNDDSIIMAVNRAITHGG